MLKCPPISTSTDCEVKDNEWTSIEKIELRIDPSESKLTDSERETPESELTERETPKAVTVEVTANVQGRKNRVGYCKYPQY